MLVKFIDYKDRIFAINPDSVARIDTHDFSGGWIEGKEEMGTRITMKEENNRPKDGGPTEKINMQYYVKLLIEEVIEKINNPK